MTTKSTAPGNNFTGVTYDNKTTIRISSVTEDKPSITFVSVGEKDLFHTKLLSLSTNQSPAVVRKNVQDILDNVIFSTVNVTRCMMENKTLNYKVANFTLSYFQYEDRHDSSIPGNSRAHGNHTCWFNLTTRNDTVVKIHFTEQTCSKDNYISLWIQVNESVNYLDSRTGCEDHWSPLLVEYISLVNSALFGIVIRNFSAPYVMQLHITAVASEERRKAQIHYLQHIGKLVSL